MGLKELFQKMGSEITSLTFGKPRRLAHLIKGGIERASKSDILDKAIKGSVEYFDNKMTPWEGVQSIAYENIGRLFPLAHSNLINARYNLKLAKQDPNAFIYSKSDFKSPDMNSFLGKLKIPDNNPVVLYNNDSAYSEQLANSKRMEEFINTNREALKNGRFNQAGIDFGYPKNQFDKYRNDKTAIDNYLGLQHATLYKPHIDNKGYFNTLVSDVYDFVPRTGLNPFNLPNNWGATMQRKNLIANPAYMYYIHKYVGEPGTTMPFRNINP